MQTQNGETELRIGAVAYAPKVVTIWEGIRELSLLKILSHEELEQVGKPRATSRDVPALAAGCAIRGRRAIQI
jgi:hypothetical protein